MYEVLDLMASSDEFYTSYHSIYGKVVAVVALHGCSKQVCYGSAVVLGPCITVYHE